MKTAGDFEAQGNYYMYSNVDDSINELHDFIDVYFYLKKTI